MSRLDPKALFARIAGDIPSDLHSHLFVTGSLAAAYHFADQIQERTVNTKDADLVVHPAGDVMSCQQIANQLLQLGWNPKPDARFRPQPNPDPSNILPFIRLHPPDSSDYFIEFLTLPPVGQKERLRCIPIQLPDGWYAAPSFRYFVLLELHRQRSAEGIEYASPAMMALANLLSHPELGTQVIDGDDRLRSAKDLGRILALARFTGVDAIDEWTTVWLDALKRCFPDEWQALAKSAGSGLVSLLSSDLALEQARQFNEAGLLSGKYVTTEMLRITATRLIQDVLEPLAERATQ